MEKVKEVAKESVKNDSFDKKKEKIDEIKKTTNDAVDEINKLTKYIFDQAN